MNVAETNLHGLTGSADRANFRPDIEGLRGIAILLVVAFHADIPGWPGGFIGVDVFFVISGYVITRLLIGELETKGRLSLCNFYARRARRLLPASAVTLLATLLVGFLLLSPLEQITLSKTAFATAFYVSNVFFQRRPAHYFGGDNCDTAL